MTSISSLVVYGGDTLSAQVDLDTMAMRAHTHFLSQDLLRGRDTGTPGSAVAALYIASQCRALGLRRVGDHYRHKVELERLEFLDHTRLLVRDRFANDTYTFTEDFVLNVGTRNAFRDFEGSLFFLGTEELTRELIDTLPLTGTVIMTFGARVDLDVIHGLGSQGVQGIIHLIGDPSIYDLYVQSRGMRPLYHADSAVASSFLPTVPSVIASPHLSRRLLTDVALADGRAVGSRSVLGRATLEIGYSQSRALGHNVLCWLPGTEPGKRDTAIVFTAHYDHLGVGHPSASGDSIYNGFSDNAAGVAMLLAVAQAFATDADALQHSALFLFLTGEERGLLGSDEYVHRPVWPLDRILAVINLDAGAPPGPPTSWELAGVDSSSGLGEIATRVATRSGWSVRTSHPRPNSDYYPFVRRGVPAVFIIPGPGPYEGMSPQRSAELKQRWDAYHQPSDEWHEEFPFAGLLRYGSFAYLVGRELDGSGSPVGPVRIHN